MFLHIQWLLWTVKVNWRQFMLLLMTQFTSSVTVIFLNAWMAAFWTESDAASFLIHVLRKDLRLGLALSITAPMFPIACQWWKHRKMMSIFSPRRGVIYMLQFKIGEKGNKEIKIPEVWGMWVHLPQNNHCQAVMPWSLQHLLFPLSRSSSHCRT